MLHTIFSRLAIALMALAVAAVALVVASEPSVPSAVRLLRLHEAVA